MKIVTNLAIKDFSLILVDMVMVGTIRQLMALILLKDIPLKATHRPDILLMAATHQQDILPQVDTHQHHILPQVVIRRQHILPQVVIRRQHILPQVDTHLQLILVHLLHIIQVFIQSDVLEVALDMREKFDAFPDELLHVDKIDPNVLCNDEGWLFSNPMGIRTEREIHAEFEGAKIYRRLYQKRL